jgi:hypothetical protein
MCRQSTRLSRAERLPAIQSKEGAEQIDELRLKRADDDAVWDVTRRYIPPGEVESYSKSGRSPWQTLIRMPPIPPH